MMKNNNYIKKQLTMFIVMVIVGITCNPMNMLAYRKNDVLLSTTLIYGGLLMASNMIWAHEIVHYLSMGHINIKTFLFGIILSFIIVKFLLRNQLFVDDEQWLKRMISHHSTAITTSHNIYNKTNNIKVKQLAENIINTQEKEIEEMKQLL